MTRKAAEEQRSETGMRAFDVTRTDSRAHYAGRGSYVGGQAAWRPTYAGSAANLIGLAGRGGEQGAREQDERGQGARGQGARDGAHNDGMRDGAHTGAHNGARVEYKGFGAIHASPRDTGEMEAIVIPQAVKETAREVAREADRGVSTATSAATVSTATVPAATVSAATEKAAIARHETEKETNKPVLHGEVSDELHSDELHSDELHSGTAGVADTTGDGKTDGTTDGAAASARTDLMARMAGVASGDESDDTSVYSADDAEDDEDEDDDGEDGFTLFGFHMRRSRIRAVRSPSADDLATGRRAVVEAQAVASAVDAGTGAAVGRVTGVSADNTARRAASEQVSGSVSGSASEQVSESVSGSASEQVEISHGPLLTVLLWIAVAVIIAATSLWWIVPALPPDVVDSLPAWLATIVPTANWAASAVEFIPLLIGAGIVTLILAVVTNERGVAVVCAACIIVQLGCGVSFFVGSCVPPAAHDGAPSETVRIVVVSEDE